MSTLDQPRIAVGTSGSRAFLWLWTGQVVSVFGSGLSGFALRVWVFEKTHSATDFGLLGFFASFPALALAPFIGVLVDRWSRRSSMILADAGCGLVTAWTALLVVRGQLTIPLLCAAMVTTSIVGSFRWPAYSAAIPLLVPKGQLDRASGLDQFGQSGVQLLAPAAAALLLAEIALSGVLLLDVATYLVALATLLSVHIPRPSAAVPSSAEAAAAEPGARHAGVGWRFIRERPPLRQLLSILALMNLLAGLNLALSTPLVLSLASPTLLGVVLSVSTAGVLAGGLFLTITGGLKDRARAILSFGLLYGVAFVLIGVRPSPWLILTASFVLMFAVAVINGCSQVIWQSKVPASLQGRVFTVRRMIAQASLPLAFLIAGPLADRLFIPLLEGSADGRGSLTWLLGAGAGRGIGAIYILSGGLFLLVAVIAYRSPTLRRIEELLPDCFDEGERDAH